MSPRAYDRRQRDATKAATRERIVSAAIDLYSGKGLVETTYADIGRRADVAVTTIHNHFPSRSALLAACQEHLASLVPPLQPDVFAGQVGLAGRLAALVRAVFAQHALVAAPAQWAAAVAGLVPELRADAEKVLTERVRLIVQAMAPGFDGGPPPAAVALAEVLLDFPAWSSLTRDLGPEEAEDAVVEALLALARGARD